MGLSTKVLSQLDGLGDWGLLATDTGLTVTGWNRWLELRTGRSAEHVLGQKLFDLFPDLITRGFDKYFRQALIGQTAILSQRFHKFILSLPVFFGKDDSRMLQSGRIIPLLDGANVSGTLTIIEDVTEREMRESELRSRAEELTKADRRKDEFLAMLAHELRNPLAPVRNAVQILLTSRTDDPTVTRLAELIGRQVGQMTHMIGDLLDVSRITHNKVELRRERVVMADAITRAVETARPLIEARRHELHVSVPPEEIVTDADPMRLTQMLGNLLNNAAKYTEENGQIFVTVNRAGTDAEVRIRDTGIGLAPDMLSRVFDLFTQENHTLDRSQGGLGIGLTLVRSLVELHGGDVYARSDGPGRGSEFVLRLPALPPSPKVRVEGASSTPTAETRYRLLIVDDNTDSAESLAELLALTGHEARTAHDGPTALIEARAFRPEVILLDIGLPRMNGYEVASHIRENPDLQTALLIAMTGYGQEDDRRKSQEAGFDHHLVKPVDFAELQRLLVSRVVKDAN